MAPVDHAMVQLFLKRPMRCRYRRGVPLAWFPRLLNATPEHRAQVEISRNGLHWDALDEGISIADLLAGRSDLTGWSSRNLE